jgi:hypothetical protein
MIGILDGQSNALEVGGNWRIVAHAEIGPKLLDLG